MKAIVSVTEDWGIGNKGSLIVRNREDMRRFVRLTMGSTVVMGRTTFESFPSGPLKGRRNIVVTRDPGYAQGHPGIECVASPDEALALVADEEGDKVWLIGGESLYRALLDACECCYVTRNRVHVEADAFFPNLDDDPRWILEEIEGQGVTEEDVEYDFARYRQMA